MGFGAVPNAMRAACPPFEGERRQSLLQQVLPLRKDALLGSALIFYWQAFILWLNAGKPAGYFRAQIELALDDQQPPMQFHQRS